MDGAAATAMLAVVGELDDEARQVQPPTPYFNLLPPTYYYTVS
jgi:hypothetical protein